MNEAYVGVGGTWIGVKVSDNDIITNSPKITFENWTRSRFINMANSGFILFDEIGGGGETIIDRIGGWIIFEKFVDKMLDDSLE